MKKDDVIGREYTLPIGYITLHNCDSEEKARSFMENDFAVEYGTLPSYKVDIVEGQSCIVLESPILVKETAKVIWVIDNEASIQLKDGGYKIINLDEDKDWIVIQESVPSYQSSVADMSDDELRASIDALRARRPGFTETKVRVKSEKVSNDPMAAALAVLPADKKLELMKKMGLID